MRIIIHGVGAVGGTLAVKLAASGAEVMGIARGRMLEAIRAEMGLTLITPLGAEKADFPCVGSPADIDWRPDDVVILTMKSQDTEAALEDLLAAGVRDQAIVCGQNGVDNERQALRRFANVYGMTILLPAQYLRPGEIVAFGAPKQGVFDLGRYPSGTGATAEALSALLSKAGFGCAPHAQVMASKHGKLIMNLRNMLSAAFGPGAVQDAWYQRAKDEALSVLAAAGVAVEDLGLESPRRAEMKITPIEGIERLGSSSDQSLARGTGSIETDYLNGEIVLLGRLAGVPVPVNAAICAMARRMLSEGIGVGDFPEVELAALVDQA